jgi:putative glycosyltransferase (TIGR04372 family)
MKRGANYHLATYRALGLNVRAIEQSNPPELGHYTRLCVRGYPVNAPPCLMRIETDLRYRYRLAASVIWAIPLALLIRLIRPLIVIRICGIRSDRIGHFVADIAEHIGREKIKSTRTFNFYFFKGPISNTQWESMAKRSSLKVVGNWLRYLGDWSQIIPGGGLHTIHTSLTDSRDVEGLFHRFDCSIPFLPSEDVSCEDWLKSKGWTKGEPFVVLLVRDSAYLSQNHSNYDWSHHSYRDSDIKTYIPAIEWLASQGVWVLRMGKSMATRIYSKSNRIVDYAFDAKKSDLLDIWLFANSSAIISTASGLDYLGGIYRKPILFLNALPLFDLASFFDMTWVPKNLIWKDSRKFLTLTETIEHTYYFSNEYEANGIEVEDLSTQVITQSVIEFWQKTSNTKKDSAGEIGTQRLFWTIFTENPKFREKHNSVHKNARVGTFWLSTMGERYLR